MTSEEPAQRDWKTISIITLAVVVVVLLGTIIGFLVSGGLSGETAGGSTTTTSLPNTTLSTLASVTTVGSTQPSSNDPPGQLTLLVVEDSYTDVTDPQEVNGFDAVLELENDPPEVKQGLVRFLVAGIPEGAAIEQLVLRVFVGQPLTSPIAVHLVDGDWNETETTSVSAPFVGERVGTIPIGGAQGEALEAELTGVALGPGPISFYLLATGEDTIEVAAKESGANAPALIVRWGQ